MATLMEARTREFEERAVARGREQAFEEMETLMEARTREFEERAVARGREQAFEEMETLMEARTREFEERAVARGIAEGERMLLRRQTERRFGAETAAQISELLSEVEDAEDLIKVGDWVVECRTGDELLERFHRIRGA